MVLLQRKAANYLNVYLRKYIGFISANCLFIKKRVMSLYVTRFCILVFLLSPMSATLAEQQSLTTNIKNQNNSSPTSPDKSNSAKPDPAKPESVKHKDNTEFVDKPLAYIQSIAQMGAIRLALLSLDEQQPSYAEDSMRWLTWERERVTLLNLSGQNKILVDRLNKLPEGLDNAFIYWAKTQQASAYLNLHEYSNVRETLSRLIWNTNQVDSEFSNRWLPHWRRLIINSYLNQGLMKDAHIAITRFRQDYGQGDISDIILYSRVLLMNNLVDEALEILSKHTSNPEAGMLHLLAQLRKNKRSPRKVLQAGLRQMQGEWVKPELKIYLWSIVAEAAQRSDDKLSGIKAMEFVFSDKNRQHLPKGLFKLSIDDLWNAYIENAIHLGNKAQYLMGDDPVWLNAAQAYDVTQAINARSLYAFLILRGQDEKIRQMAAQLFLKSLIASKTENELANQLFLHSNYFKTKKETPIAVRHFLVDDALANSNIRLASELMSSIKKSPDGSDHFMWALRRARVLVMGGDIQESAKALVELLDNQKKISIPDIDMLMQVVFDLQTVKAHSQAYTVFEKVLLHVDDIKRQREIYYWMADSKKAQKQYAKAANLYLQSAMSPEKDNTESSFDPSLDPWGQTARYQAASNLAKAGLVSDARALYTQLLEVTKDENRLKVLKHELQQLWLLEN